MRALSTATRLTVIAVVTERRERTEAMGDGEATAMAVARGAGERADRTRRRSTEGEDLENSNDRIVIADNLQSKVSNWERQTER